MARNTYVREEYMSLSGQVVKTCTKNADIGYEFVTNIKTIGKIGRPHCRRCMKVDATACNKSESQATSR